MAYPKTAVDNRELARRLVAHLRKHMHNTHTRPDWSKQNFSVLEQFAESENAKAFWGGVQRSHRQFMWDFFAGYDDGSPETAALFIAESEHNDLDFHDWEKLFYATAPVKLMMFRITDTEGAAGVMKRYADYMAENFTVMPAGEVFLLYGVYWSENENSPNRDYAWMYQVPGEPNLTTVKSPAFQAVEA